MHIALCKKDNMFKRFDIRLLWILIPIIYLIYSRISTGVYQHDEAGHFINMLTFWHDPSCIIGSWHKFGYKLFFVFPALLGFKFVTVVNCLIATLVCYLSYKLAIIVKCSKPYLAPMFLAIQPIWLEISFRCYSETLAALFLIASIILFYRKQFAWSALLCSYLVTIRHEFYLLVVLYGIYLLYKKELFSVLLLPIFSVVHHLVGVFFTGDPIFLYNLHVGYVSKIQEEYARSGFDRFFEMSGVIFGIITLGYFLYYFYNRLFKRLVVHWPIILPLLGYFLMQCVFNLKSVVVGPSTNAHIRYMTVIAPLVAVVASFGFVEAVKSLAASRTKMFAVLWIVIVIMFLSYDHNYIAFIKEKMIIRPAVVALLSMILVLVRMNNWLRITVLVSFLMWNTYFVAKPFKGNYENNIIKEVATQVVSSKIDVRPILINHSMFYFYAGKTKFDFRNSVSEFTLKDVEKATIGTIIFWDSHYSYRPALGKDTKYEYLLNNKEQFRLCHKPLVARDKKFMLLIFEKIA